MSAAASTTAARQTLAPTKTATDRCLRAGTVRIWIKFLDQRLGTWVDAHAALVGAAALYQDLSRLSDAELLRRGIPRGELLRFVLEAFDLEALDDPERSNDMLRARRAACPALKAGQRRLKPVRPQALTSWPGDATP